MAQAFAAGRRVRKRNMLMAAISAANAGQLLAGSGASTGAPAFFHAPKPPAIWATGLSPMCCAVCVALAAGFTRLQFELSQFIPLAVILLIGVAFYLLGRKTRAQVVEIPFADEAKLPQPGTHVR